MVICTSVCVLAHWWSRTRGSSRRHSNIPPGPKPLPLVGNFGAFLVPPCVWRLLAKRREQTTGKTKRKKTPLLFLMEQADVYGDVFSIHIGRQLVVILNGYDVVKDALSNHAHVFSDRPDVPIVTLMTRRKGPNGGLCQASLRTFGLGQAVSGAPRPGGPGLRQGGAAAALQELQWRRGPGVDPTAVIRTAVSNVICSMSMGHSFHHDDREFHTRLELMARGLEDQRQRPGAPVNIVPALYYLPCGVFQKVQAEMDRVVGRERLLSMKDRGTLPFTEATIMEVERLTVAVPLGIPHMASETTEFRGFTIPKGTVIIPNLWSVHRDPAVWEEPDSFRPGRFLDAEGKLQRIESFMPFGI
ncbi:hypothetical protein CRUP_033417, partial [Coryphaenoides rupestris]